MPLEEKNKVHFLTKTIDIFFNAFLGFQPLWIKTLQKILLHHRGVGVMSMQWSNLQCNHLCLIINISACFFYKRHFWLISSSRWRWGSLEMEGSAFMKCPNFFLCKSFVNPKFVIPGVCSRIFVLVHATVSSNCWESKVSGCFLSLMNKGRKRQLFS